MFFRSLALSAEGRGKRARQSVNSAGTPPTNTTSPFISSPTSPTNSPSFLPYRPLSISSVNGKENGRTFTAHDKRGRAYLADTGAEISVFPASSEDRRRPAQTPLAAANGTGIKTYGNRNIHIQLGERDFWQDFIVADVTRPILGADFFSAHYILPDLARKRLLDAAEDDWAGTPRESKIICQVAGKENEFQQLMNEFPEILTPNFKAENKHRVFHYIPTHGPPVFAKPRRLDEAKLRSAKKYFSEMEELGIIRRSNSPWASPLHVVPKADGSLRPCGDFRRLNQATVDDRYPLPHIHSFNEHLEGATIFSKVDLAKGYHQIPMAEEDVPKTAIITPFGLFEFLRMPFGLKNSAQAF